MSRMPPIGCKRQISFQPTLVFFAIVGGFGKKSCLAQNKAYSLSDQLEKFTYVFSIDIQILIVLGFHAYT